MAEYTLQSYTKGPYQCKGIVVVSLWRNSRYHRHQDLSISCAHCDIFGNISLSGGGKIPDDPFPGSQLPTPPDVLQLHPDFDFSGLWVGATFDQLSAHFDFTINLNASNQTNEFTVPLPSKTFTKSVCACVFLPSTVLD